MVTGFVADAMNTMYGSRGFLNISSGIKIPRHSLVVKRVSQIRGGELFDSGHFDLNGTL